MAGCMVAGYIHSNTTASHTSCGINLSVSPLTPIKSPIYFCLVVVSSGSFNCLPSSGMFGSFNAKDSRGDTYILYRRRRTNNDDKIQQACSNDVWFCLISESIPCTYRISDGDWILTIEFRNHTIITCSLCAIENPAILGPFTLGHGSFPVFQLMPWCHVDGVDCCYIPTFLKKKWIMTRSTCNASKAVSLNCLPVRSTFAPWRMHMGTS